MMFSARYKETQHQGTGPQINGPNTEGDHVQNSPRAFNFLRITSENKGTIAIVSLAMVVALVIFGSVYGTRHASDSQSPSSTGATASSALSNSSAAVTQPSWPSSASALISSSSMPFLASTPSPSPFSSAQPSTSQSSSAQPSTPTFLLPSSTNNSPSTPKTHSKSSSSSSQPPNLSATAASSQGGPLITAAPSQTPATSCQHGCLQAFVETSGCNTHCPGASCVDDTGCSDPYPCISNTCCYTGCAPGWTCGGACSSTLACVSAGGGSSTCS